MGICIAADEVIENNADDEALDYIIDKLITNKAAKVIVCFCDGSDVQQLIKALKRHGHQDDFTIIGRLVTSYKVKDLPTCYPFTGRCL